MSAAETRRKGGNRKAVALIAAAAAHVSLALSLSAAWAGPSDDLSQARRIVAIGGSVTEIVYALKAGDRLVARDSTSTYPPEAQALPDAGYIRALNAEGVLAVTPDAILALEGSGPPEALDVLKQAGIPLAMVPESFTAEGILAKIDRVGAALGLSDAAAGLSAAVRSDLAAAMAEAAARETKPRVLFVLSLAGGRVLASGTDTAADGIIRMAGAINAVEAFSGYKQLTDEAIAGLKPDVILMMDRGGDHGAGADELFAHPALALTPAAASRRLVRMDGLYLLGFGPRTAAAVRDLAVALRQPGSTAQ
ncbi:heme/hemin ABC transporter substrate-binding protein [Pannonibacter tanglangensis]|uniref:ABC transporter substrate-binding protein n=1 Tax=Pannonibacter tanglangensis TaxID=2750084 RepID=A0ABW9ZDQ0_9HYPH|nr:ABC transporter substrate-binding protein [Pannonibacter sp. XCT-34]NBN62158.1 ABC transporter substrate-binding protein [Pannonibacter sp. XCT-34]